MRPDVVNTGHKRSDDCKVKVKLNAWDRNSGLLEESPVFVGPIHLCLFCSLNYVTTALYLSV